MTQAVSSAQSTHSAHLSIAEAGKVLALKGNHEEALRHYREAIRIAVSTKSPEIFFRHYTQCVLESLEHSGSHEEVNEYCRSADEHYRNLDISLPIIRRDHASTLERWGINLLKAGQIDAGAEKLKAALDLAQDGLPISKALVGWLARALTPDNRRIAELQRKHRYFTVRSDQVDASFAREIGSNTPESRIPNPL